MIKFIWLHLNSSATIHLLLPNNSLWYSRICINFPSVHYLPNCNVIYPLIMHQINKGYLLKLEKGKENDTYIYGIKIFEMVQGNFLQTKKIIPEISIIITKKQISKKLIKLSLNLG
ncbi:unnamed protein product [Lupinus luteus]|uniref:Uncharacterized protein n=1 Tax=Lupinus luteus TaxID=3873 RepID=A0AAV1VVP2_LUPLU